MKTNLKAKRQMIRGLNEIFAQEVEVAIPEEKLFCSFCDKQFKESKMPIHIANHIKEHILDGEWEEHCYTLEAQVN